MRLGNTLLSVNAFSMRNSLMILTANAVLGQTGLVRGIITLQPDLVTR
jgi:hypothetical protein